MAMVTTAGLKVYLLLNQHFLVGCQKVCSILAISSMNTKLPVTLFLGIVLGLTLLVFMHIVDNTDNQLCCL